MSKSNFFDFLQTEFGWPKPGERIFTETRNLSSAARIDEDGPSRHWHMIEGHKGSADILADSILSDSGANFCMIYPLVFCYRHALELMLKHIVNEFGKAAGEKRISDGHQLLPLWRIARRVIEHFGRDEASLSKVDGYISELDKIDPGSVTFRYPSDKANNVYRIGVYYVDVANLKASINALTEYLDCAAFGMGASSDTYWKVV